VVEGVQPFYQNVQAHYDLSNEFFALFLDPTMTYSCAYFEHPQMTLEEAQLAKIDLSLGKCDLQAGQRLLDVGCGWGALLRRAADRHGIRAIGLTLSKNQHDAARAACSGRSDIEIRLQGWEEFDEPVDRIISIGALEHFRIDRYDLFFQRCMQILPAGGRMLIHSIVAGKKDALAPGERWYDREFVGYLRFMSEAIFPGAQVPQREVVIAAAERNGFAVTNLQSLQSHYARTLDCWEASLVAAKERTRAIVPYETYENYVRYLRQSAHYFRTRHSDVVQFTMERR